LIKIIIVFFRNVNSGGRANPRKVNIQNKVQDMDSNGSNRRTAESAP
jgi:hypothetical protein